MAVSKKLLNICDQVCVEWLGWLNTKLALLDSSRQKSEISGEILGNLFRRRDKILKDGPEGFFALE